MGGIFSFVFGLFFLSLFFFLFVFRKCVGLRVLSSSMCERGRDNAYKQQTNWPCWPFFLNYRVGISECACVWMCVCAFALSSCRYAGSVCVYVCVRERERESE
jgi:hypothetical protein